MSAPTDRWRAAVAATALLATAGAVAGHAGLLVAALLPLGALAGSRLGTGPDPALGVRREIDPTPAPPGRPVAVRLVVENRGDRRLRDVRVIDGVPADLAALSGSPRAATTLDPGETALVSYDLAARRGTHTFDPPTIHCRSVGAGRRATLTPAVAGDDRLDCRIDAGAPPIDDEGALAGGQRSTDDPGGGLEFHSVREYHPEDPADRIDWRHYAKRDDLATVNYRRRTGATVVIVVDARESTRVAAGPGRPTAVELSAYAATRATSDLLAGGNEISVAVIGVDGPDADGLHWLDPGRGADHRARAIDRFQAAADAESAGPVDDQIARIASLAPPRAQLLVFSPLLDDRLVDALATWGAHDFSRTLCSPDVLTHNTVTGTLARVRRQSRLARCQAAGVRTVDWKRGTPLAVVLQQAFASEPGGGN
ncbi:DUF58 domain-containing protein [Halococcoides cellulosivorans]|uniref:DUF58 domain-containing protein n=1 Tax=Halococcoides cellulosivorans TaxID=1679096 RepID=A0A2R4X2W5_9EURY|nr:DUF58 domain-containing protein [Halococcoides cellulosivorans]AWB28138.1 DUF58 domain-containing protein [Halococcoides cellulosivorans]